MPTIVHASGSMHGHWCMLYARTPCRYVTKHADPVMATGWHMVLGGALLLSLALQQDPAAITEALQGLGTQVR